MKTVWNADQHRELHDRIARLTPAAAARWGKMTAPQMVMHLCESVRMAAGELAVAPKRLPLRYPVIKQLVICWAPFPKGAPTAPELIARVPGEWTADTRELQSRLNDYVKRGASAATLDHPAFGKMTPTLWGVLMYRHLDHHLKQFGV